MSEQVDKRETPKVLTFPSWLRPTELDEYLCQPDPRVRWLVRGLVPASALVMISGPRKKAYKSFFAFLIALLYAYGESYWGFDNWVVEESGNVLIIEEESTAAENKQRFRNLILGAKLKGKKKGQIFFQLHARYKFDNPKMVTDLIAFMKTNEIKLVIFDAFTYMMSGDPNSTRDILVCASSIQDIRAQTGATVMWLAHTSKESEKVDADPDMDVRNSSVLADIYDAHIAVRRKKPRILTTYCKFKAWAEKELEMFWNFPPENPDGSFAEGPIYPDVANVTGDKRSLDVVERLIESGWVPGRIYTAAAFRQATGLSSGAAATMRAQLVEAGRLKLGPDGTGVGLPSSRGPRETNMDGAGNRADVGTGAPAGVKVSSSQAGRGPGEGDRQAGQQPSPPSPEAVDAGDVRDGEDEPEA